MDSEYLRIFCTNPGSTLCAANPRITFQPALSANCASANLTTNEMHVWSHKNAYHSFCGISAHLLVWGDERGNKEPWDTVRPSRNTSTAIFSMTYARTRIRGGGSGRSVINIVKPHALALRVSFLSGYCSVAYRHPRSAPTLDNCNTQR